MKLFRFAATGAFSGFLALALSSTALAQDIDAVLERFRQVVAEQGSTIDWESSADFTAPDGRGGVELEGVTITTGDAPVEIDTLQLIAISEVSEGYRIENIVMPRYEHSEDEGEAIITDVSLDGVVLSPEGQENALGTTFFYDGLRVGELTLSSEGSEVFSLSGLTVSLMMPEGSDGMVFQGEAESFQASLAQAEDPAVREAAEAMGYSEITGSLAIAGSWTPESGELTLSQYDLTVDDAGTLGITMEIGGYTTEFLQSLREVQAQMAASPDADNSAQGLAILGLMQQLTFTTARIDFTDDSLTERVLQYVADSQGSTPSAVANQAKALVPFAMMQLNNQELTQMVTAAVNSFLDNPGSLSIIAQPANAVPFAMIMAGAMSAPQALPQQLGVRVIANE